MNLKKYRSQLPKIRYIQKALAAGRSSRAEPGTWVLGIVAEMRQLLRICGKGVGPRVNLRRMASSHLPYSSFAYKSHVEGQKTRLESCKLGFSLIQCSVVQFSSSFLLYFLFVLDHVLEQSVIQQRKREIDVIESDNI